MFCAHINSNTLEEQSVKDHLFNVASLSKKYGMKISLGSIAELIGILHDMGKQTNTFDTYIRYSIKHPEDKSLKGKIDHSTAGAKFIYDNFFNSSNPCHKLTSQIIALAICSHHGGLINCLDLDGINVFSNRIHTNKNINYDEAVTYFTMECKTIEDIEALFNKSSGELKEIIKIINTICSCSKEKVFFLGMIQKYLFSCLIDADRYDTYMFMESKKRSEGISTERLWNELSDILENKLKKFPNENNIDVLRQTISNACKQFAQHVPGVYQLSVPTGGGKTLSSLRYALEHAKIYKKDRIFYIIPFTTIIDQNAKEIKNILGHEDIILEHHSNVMIDNDSEEYKLLTERWDSPIILTTMVQFLNTLFDGGTQNIRRMHNLANSVIIFDEIQSLPIKCVHMFNSAINFLAYICKATVVLCTATQPLLSTTQIPLKLSENPNIVENTHEKFKKLERTIIIDQTIPGGYTAETISDFILDEINKRDSILVILNTKACAKKVFNQLKKRAQESSVENEYYVFHLSTNMCPAHRIHILKTLKKKLGKQKLICISTQLIEAGVNISFDCVIRSLAGLDSIAQAAGRCNRHGKNPRGYVYIVNMQDENLERLPDIRIGQQKTELILLDFKKNPEVFDYDLLSPKALELYYKHYFNDRKIEMNYTLSRVYKGETMYELLSDNKNAIEAFQGRNGCISGLALEQSFKIAGKEFNVIDQNTTSILVPYKEGEELIKNINGNCNLEELKKYLKRAQQYSVNLFETDLRKLAQLGAIVKLREGSIFALRKEFYDEENLGVIFEEKEMNFLNF